MSIWSRSHSDLAKLARTLQDRNAHIRQGLLNRGQDEWQQNTLRKRVKSDSCLPVSVVSEYSFTKLSLTDSDSELLRNRVDSFSSVDSAISPDFPRGPPSPILKTSSLCRSADGRWKQAVSANGNSPNGPDKKVKFLLETEESSSENEGPENPAAVDNEEERSIDTNISSADSSNSSTDKSVSDKLDGVVSDSCSENPTLDTGGTVITPTQPLLTSFDSIQNVEDNKSGSPEVEGQFFTSSNGDSACSQSSTSSKSSVLYAKAPKHDYLSPSLNVSGKSSLDLESLLCDQERSKETTNVDIPEIQITVLNDLPSTPNKSLSESVLTMNSSVYSCADHKIAQHVSSESQDFTENHSSSNGNPTKTSVSLNSSFQHNISSELNLLLISLLTNHRRQQMIDNGQIDLNTVDSSLTDTGSLASTLDTRDIKDLREGGIITEKSSVSEEVLYSKSQNSVNSLMQEPAKCVIRNRDISMTENLQMLNENTLTIGDAAISVTHSDNVVCYNEQQGLTVPLSSKHHYPAGNDPSSAGQSLNVPHLDLHHLSLCDTPSTVLSHTGLLTNSVVTCPSLLTLPSTTVTTTPILVSTVILSSSPTVVISTTSITLPVESDSQVHALYPGVVMSPNAIVYAEGPINSPTTSSELRVLATSHINVHNGESLHQIRGGHPHLTSPYNPTHYYCGNHDAAFQTSPFSDSPWKTVPTFTTGIRMSCQAEQSEVVVSQLDPNPDPHEINFQDSAPSNNASIALGHGFTNSSPTPCMNDIRTQYQCHGRTNQTRDPNCRCYLNGSSGPHVSRFISLRHNSNDSLVLSNSRSQHEPSPQRNGSVVSLIRTEKKHLTPSCQHFPSGAQGQIFSQSFFDPQDELKNDPSKPVFINLSEANNFSDLPDSIPIITVNDFDNRAFSADQVLQSSFQNSEQMPCQTYPDSISRASAPFFTASLPHGRAIIHGQFCNKLEEVNSSVSLSVSQSELKENESSNLGVCNSSCQTEESFSEPIQDISVSMSSAKCDSSTGSRQLDENVSVPSVGRVNIEADGRYSLSDSRVYDTDDSSEMSSFVQSENISSDRLSGSSCKARVARINDNVSRLLKSHFLFKGEEDKDQREDHVHTVRETLNSNTKKPDHRRRSEVKTTKKNRSRTLSPPLSPSSVSNSLSSDASSSALLDILSTVQMIGRKANRNGSRRNRLSRSQLHVILQKLEDSKDFLASNPSPELRAVKDDLHKLSTTLGKQLKRNKESLVSDIQERSTIFYSGDRHDDSLSRKGSGTAPLRKDWNLSSNCVRSIKKLSSDFQQDNQGYARKKSNLLCSLSLDNKIQSPEGKSKPCGKTLLPFKDDTPLLRAQKCLGNKPDVKVFSGIAFVTQAKKVNGNGSVKNIEDQVELLMTDSRGIKLNLKPRLPLRDTKWTNQTKLRSSSSSSSPNPFSEMYKFMCDELDSSLSHSVTHPEDEFEPHLAVSTNSENPSLKQTDNEIGKLVQTKFSSQFPSVSHETNPHKNDKANTVTDNHNLDTHISHPQHSAKEDLLLSQQGDEVDDSDHKKRPPPNEKGNRQGQNEQLPREVTEEQQDEAKGGKGIKPDAMESESELSFQLDREFDKHLADMKPYVLKLHHKTERQKCAVWIKKLCEPPGHGTAARKTRNMYAQLMLQMLKKGSLHSPFDQKPEEGPLKPLPSYMSIYFDDPLNDVLHKAERLPDWVEGELGDTVGSSMFPKSLGQPAATSTWVSSVGEFRERPHSSMGHTLEKDPSLSPIRNSEFVRSTGYSADDMSIEMKQSPSPQQRRLKSYRSPTGDREKRQLPDVRLKEPREAGTPRDLTANDTDWSKPFSASLTSNYSLPKGTTYYDETSYHKPADREVAVRTKMIEAKFHEEKLKLQQKHDAAVQKILDRKNTEIEDVKGHYRAKSKETEETVGKLERKVQTLMKETEFIRQTKDKQIAELKKMTDESNETRRSEFEKRLHDVMAEFEHEKFELQKEHTQNIQEILDDTNNRLQRMEAEYSQQTTTTTNVIKELETRVQQLMNEVDSTLSQRSAVEKEKKEALAKFERLMNEHERLKEKMAQREKDNQTALEAHEHELRSLKNKTEASLEYFKQEHSIAASKASDTISELEEKVEQLKKSLKDTEEHRHRQIRELEQSHQQDKLHLENLHDKQIRSMKKEMEQLDSDWGKKLAKQEQQIKDRDQEISKLKEQKHQQNLQAEQALDEFKAQVEKNQARIYDDMKQQMQQVENDLQKSKLTREKQSKEFSRQLDEEKYKHQHEIAELKMAAEGEKSQMMRELHVQKEYILTEHERDMENLKELHRAEIQALEARLRERQDKADKSATDGERIIRELREELVQANQLRKQQLVELGLLREEEKQKMQRDHEAELSRMRTDIEQQRLEMQKAHSAEMETVLEKTNDRLKTIEKDYAERGSKSSESIAELQGIVAQLRGDIKRSRESSDEKLAELKHQYEEEKQSLRKQYSQNLNAIQRELDSQRNRARNAERQVQKAESDQEEKITQLKYQFEERIRGLMPADLKQELEDTIASLKSQVSTLQQRCAMLQEELDNRNKNPLGSFGSMTSSPIKSAV